MDGFVPVMKIRHISYSGVLSLFPYALLTAPIIGFQFFSSEALEFQPLGQVGERQAQSRTWNPPPASVSVLPSEAKHESKKRLKPVIQPLNPSSSGDTRPPQPKWMTMRPSGETLAPEADSSSALATAVVEPGLPEASTPTKDSERWVELSPSLEEEVTEDLASMRAEQVMTPEPASEPEVESVAKSGEVASCDPDDPDQMYFKPSIIQVDERTWMIPEELVSFYANNPAKLKKLAGTYTWKNAEGEKAGFRVKPTKCSILVDAGFQRNDVILSINGQTLSTVRNAVPAYFKLKGATTFEVVILRKTKGGKRVEITQTYQMDRGSPVAKKGLRERVKERQAVRSERRSLRRFKRKYPVVATKSAPR